VIDIILEIDSDKIIRKCVIKGHSGFSKKGKDIVCAGISILANTFVLSLNGIKEVKYKLYDDNDYMVCIEEYKDDIKSILKGLSLFLIIGLKAISKEYTNNVKLKMIKE
jgi:uncharacterized protein YsxB (DUF464 family)